MTESERQRRVREEGNLWEMYVAKFLEDCLSSEGYKVYREQDLPQGLRDRLSLEVPPLWGEIDLNAIGDTGKILGDLDTVVAKDEEPLVIVSCKLSLHNRLTETLFWSILYHRQGVRVVLATPDKGQNGSSEWGQPNRPNKNRQLARRFLAGVYVENHPEFCPPTVKTHFGDVVKPLKQLPEDIRRWYP
ncbi:MAG: BsaWI family type II restriction enzyme [Armatimonadota bacterium]